MWVILACINIEENNLVKESGSDDDDNDYRGSDDCSKASGFC
jgi:hypothetical protein